MARTSLNSGSRAASTSTSSTTNKIAKRVTPRTTRQRSRIACTNASNNRSGVMGLGGLEIVANEPQTVAGQNEDIDADAGKAHADLEREDAAAFYRSICPITDKDDMSFRLMELPTEIRLEIYRACLTRPYPILLSRQSQLPKSRAGHDSNPPADFAPPPRRRRSLRATASQSSSITPGVISGIHTQSALSLPASNSAIGAASRPQFLAPPSGIQAGTHPESGDGSTLVGDKIPRNQREDPLLISILRVSKEVYKEARGVLYSENYFTLDLNTAQSTLACLHQRSRRQIKHIELEIPSYNDILERFQETVRLSLRYCSGLKECRIHMPFMLPGADGSGTSGNTTVYANGFDILRWLPQDCNIALEGTTCVEIEQVVNKHRQLARTLDKLAYARRQLISNETGQSQA